MSTNQLPIMIRYESTIPWSTKLNCASYLWCLSQSARLFSTIDSHRAGAAEISLQTVQHTVQSRSNKILVILSIRGMSHCVMNVSLIAADLRADHQLVSSFSMALCLLQKNNKLGFVQMSTVCSFNSVTFELQSQLNDGWILLVDLQNFYQFSG